MTVPLQTQHDIREMDARGAARAEIARELGVSRNTVAKYADMEDMSPAPPLPAERARPSLAGHEEWIDSALAAELGAPRKQRHTAKRIYDRLVAERGYSGSYSSVCRHVAEWRAGRAAAGGGFLELEWAPGTAQVDYGNFAAVLAGREVAPKLLVLTLPHPDARFCAAGMSERSECLCEGLAGIFDQMGRAPTALVLDNATEAGRRIAGVVTESELFSRFRAHYRCSSRYCNPYSGHEKRVRRERRGLPGEEPAGPGARGARATRAGSTGSSPRSAGPPCWLWTSSASRCSTRTAPGFCSRWSRRPTRGSRWWSRRTSSSRAGARSPATTRWPPPSLTASCTTAASCSSGASRTGCATRSCSRPDPLGFACPNP